ncbi:TspO/MBR family protein [Legionella worsleiensis]|uniref:Tryptophan-rich sensory protein n=1 Tax=Legionella worsleiensis TaxID=45076 RepID=A0A0W1AKU2_9GAMM|nr:TspO/MBR family protein [Legionella worsleiensis]KTD81910.1 tryptophan-rich sensory protein [Legionella worsleiensis]STY31229.1 tryptophan-rich sensory protein [Legionella worsleiensis]
MRFNSFTKLVLLVVLFESIGFLLGLITQANIYPWYANLVKSPLTPPGYVFSIVWSLLYALLALVALLVFAHDKNNSTNTLTALFVAQMVMNWAWTPLFFGLHWVTLSAFWLVGLIILNLLLLIKARKNNRLVIWLLIPYLIWLLFAAYLNGYIALMN